MKLPLNPPYQGSAGTIIAPAGLFCSGPIGAITMSLHHRVARAIATNKSLLLFFALMMVFRSAFADWMYVPTGSMNPTIVEGDRILVNKMAYGLRVPFTTQRLTHGSDPQRGDIVIFPSPKDDITLVKRVIGIPGDTVEMRDERLTINGKQIPYAPTVDAADADLLQSTRAENRYYLSEDLGGRTHSVLLLPRHATLRTFGPIIIPPDRYLMLGDSRDNSEDGRFFGLVARESIVGKAFKVAYSLDSDRWYRPRADRFLAPLQ
jgi:signal peptidase I